MARTINQHLDAARAAGAGSELRGFGYRKVADSAARAALTDQVVGEIVTQVDTGRSYQWTGATWDIWTRDGTVTRDNISGAATLDVAAHSAAELTLTGNITALTLSGWDTDNTIYQEIHVQLIQDATGGRTFDWSSTTGTWVESPPDTFDTTAGTTLLHFIAWSTDGGASVWLRPLGVAYSSDCLYAQTVEADVPATSAGGAATVSHSFSIVGSVDLIRQSDGRRVVADWRHVTATDPSSAVEIDFASAVAAGEFKVRVTGQSSIACVLSVSVSEWIYINLSAGAANSLSPRVDFVGPAGNAQWIWGDGSAPEDVTSGAEMTHAYGATYTGPVLLRYRRGVRFTRFESPSDRWNFDTSAISTMTDLTFLRLDGTQVSGDVGNLAGLTALTVFYGFSSSMSGDVGALSGLSSLVQLWLFSTGVTGDISQLTSISTLDNLNLANTTVSGDVGTLSAIPGIGTIQLSNTGVSGDIAPLSAVTALREFRVNDTGVTGDIAAFAAMTTLTAVQLQNTSATGAIDSLALSTGLTVIEINGTTIAGSVDSLAGLGSLINFRVNNTGVTGNPSVVSGASAGTLRIFTYLFVGALPTAPQLDQVITDLAAGTITGGTLNVSGTNPAITNTAGVATLQGRGWTVAHN